MWPEIPSSHNAGLFTTTHYEISFIRYTTFNYPCTFLFSFYVDDPVVQGRLVLRFETF